LSRALACLRLGAAVAALLLAPALALQAQVNAGGAAPSWALDLNGFRLSDLARQSQGVSASEQASSFAVPPGTLALARQAYASEPLATDSLLILANSGLSPESAKVERILQLTYDIDQRNLFVGMNLLQRSVARGDLPAMLGLVDRLTRIRPEIAAQLPKVLADSGSVPFLTDVLRQNPPWAAQFWRSVPNKELELANFLTLHRLVPAPANEAADARLLQALTGSGRYSEAMDLWRDLTGRSDIGTGFANSSRFAPIDWQLNRSGRVNARLGADGAMVAFVESGATGELARQLVALTPGRYRWSSAMTLQQGSGDVEVGLECAEPTADGQWRAEPAGKPVSWDVPQGACRFAWLVVRGSAWQSNVPLRAELTEISFARVAVENQR